MPKNKNLDASIILPTYNEANNLPIIIPKIHKTLQKANINGEIIVVDDNSPDNTAAIAKKLAQDFPVQTIIRTKNKGLSQSALAGFKQSTAKIIVVMDADGSHPIAKLPAMIKHILDNKVDITIGSRNIKGGRIEKWPWHRQLISKVAALMTAGLTKMSDPTTGFMAANREKLNLNVINPIGWKIVLETLVKHPHLKSKEIPITFKDRKFDTSKMCLKVQYDYIKHLISLYKWKYLHKS